MKRRKTSDRNRKRTAPRDLSAKAAGVKGGLLPAVRQATTVPAVQMADGSVRFLQPSLGG